LLHGEDAHLVASNGEIRTMVVNGLAGCLEIWWIWLILASKMMKTVIWPWRSHQKCWFNHQIYRIDWFNHQNGEKVEFHIILQKWWNNRDCIWFNHQKGVKQLKLGFDHPIVDLKAREDMYTLNITKILAVQT
jgi:hypothetical protein